MLGENTYKVFVAELVSGAFSHVSPCSSIVVGQVWDDVDDLV